MSDTRTFRFDADLSRRLPDPVFRKHGGQRHVFLVKAEEMPDDLPKDPNPREQRIDKGIYKDVTKSLLNEEGTPNTFHLKNKGITAIATKVKQLDDGGHLVEFPPGYGIVDGGHTYEIVVESKETLLELIDAGQEIEQYVKVEVLTGIPEHLIPEVARGLNTAVQVQEMSLAELRDEFDWIKDELADEPYFPQIAFKENLNDVTTYDARDIVVWLDCFNIDIWPNDGDENPVRAFQSKAKVLDAYLADRKSGRRSYEKLRPILKDILVLRDRISYDACEIHNAAGGKARKLAFVEKRKHGTYHFLFIDEDLDARLTRGALLPMLAAFRWMVVERDGQFAWRTSFDDVLALWSDVGAELMRATQSTSEDHSYQPNLIGKSRNHWATLHSTVAKRQLLAAAA